MAERRWAIYVCDKGHVEAGSLNGVCWACYPGGRRTWEPGEPKQTEPNQERIEVVPASQLSDLEAENERLRGTLSHLLMFARGNQPVLDLIHAALDFRLEQTQ